MDGNTDVGNTGRAIWMETQIFLIVIAIVKIVLVNSQRLEDL